MDHAITIAAIQRYTITIQLILSVSLQFTCNLKYAILYDYVQPTCRHTEANHISIWTKMPPLHLLSWSLLIPNSSASSTRSWMATWWPDRDELNLAMDGTKVARIAASTTRSWTASSWMDDGDLDLAMDGGEVAQTMVKLGPSKSATRCSRPIGGHPG